MILVWNLIWLHTMTSVLKFKYLFTTIFLIIGTFLWVSYPRIYQVTGSAFGTYYKVIVIGSKFSVNEKKLKSKVESRLIELDQLFSTYRIDSELMKLNLAPVNVSVSLKPEAVSLIELSIQLKKKIGKSWDPTLVPLSKKYGFSTIKELRGSVVGLEHLSIVSSSEVIKRADIVLDLSSIAKGYAVDQLSNLVNKYKITGAYVDIGGEIKTFGNRVDGKPWGIGIQSPVKTKELIHVIYANNMAIATSGNYLNYKEKNGKKIGHILDPRSKSYIKHDLISVSIVAQECAIADAVATGVFVMGVKEAKKWLNQNKYPALLIVRKNGKIESKFINGFDRLLNPSMSFSF